MVEIKIQYAGDLRCEASHGPSGQALHTDAPVDNHGRGESFSPTDLLATATGACMATILGIAAPERGWDLTRLAVRVEKHMVADPHRRVGRLVLEFSGLPTDLDAAGRASFERIAAACPVAHSLHPDLELDLRFAWA